MTATTEYNSVEEISAEADRMYAESKARDDCDTPKKDINAYIAAWSWYLEESDRYLKDKLLDMAIQLDLIGEVPKHKIGREIVKLMKEDIDKELTSASWIIHSLPKEYTTKLPDYEEAEVV